MEAVAHIVALPFFVHSISADWNKEIRFWGNTPD